MALSNVFTMSPGVKLLGEALSNRDFAGRRIVEPGAPGYQKLGQVAEHVAGALISPYATFGPTLQPGSSRGTPLHEFLTQVTDTKVPTERQIAGKHKGELITLREARARERKPRGLIEYWAR